MATKKKYKSDTLDGLLPTFKDKVVRVLELMKGDGFDPVLFDALRTPAEAARNAAAGKGIVQSMHLYGAAADVICGEHGWSCATHGCRFFSVLQKHVTSLKLLSGSTFTKVDRPHFQGVSIKQQTKMRKLGTKPETVDQRDELVRDYLER